MILGNYRIGADIVVALDFPDGLPSGTFTAGMALAGSDNPLSIGSTSIPMTVANRSADAVNPAGLTLTKLHSDTDYPTGPGVYAIDVKDTNGSAVSITDAPAFIRLFRSAV